MKQLSKNIFLFSIFSLFLLSCDDTYISSIPDYPVNLRLDLYTNPYNTIKENSNHYLIFDLNSPNYGGIYGIGYGGILVFCGWDSKYYAFDLSCPYEHKQNIKIKPNGLGQAICDSCKTVYDISYGVGNPTSGKAKEYLKSYKAVFLNGYLYVTNK